MTALDALRSFDSIPVVTNLSQHFNRAKLVVKPYAPFTARLLLVSAFLEDAFRTLLEYKSQIFFFSHELSLPQPVALVCIAVSTSVTVVGAAMIFFKRAERNGARLLLATVVYQQVIYGRHSPITSGNLGFLLRNLCLVGTLLLMMTNRRIKDGLPALPGIPSASVKTSSRDNIALFTRLLMGLLCVEMFDVIGWGWAAIILPISFAMLIGYKTDVMGVILMTFYTIATVTSKQFWFVHGSNPQSAFLRDVMRFEFLQTISIMSGLLMLIMSGPGALSLDEKLNKGKAW